MKVKLETASGDMVDRTLIHHVNFNRPGKPAGYTGAGYHLTSAGEIVCAGNPDGSYWLVEDDCPLDRETFEHRAMLCEEEIRILHAEARAEFGY